MKVTTPINELLAIDFPMIMAPMFLVSNEKMMKSGIDAGVMATFPTLNYRTEEELAEFNILPWGNYKIGIYVSKKSRLVIFLARL